MHMVIAMIVVFSWTDEEFYIFSFSKIMTNLRMDLYESNEYRRCHLSNFLS